MTVGQPEIPGYEIVKPLGRGGMATVYLAIQQPINRHVALKIMSNQLGDDNVWAKRFIQEAQVIAQLTHPSIVPVFDVGTHEGHFYISMEYLEGGSLKALMSQGIPIPEVLRIVVGVAAGLDFAGEKGFVHRDIKPDNIMFRDDGSPVVLDFGIVKQMEDGPNKMTQTGVIVGTTSYMSPEQAQGRDLDQRSDIYALGVMFFELLTGRPPFKGDTDVATLLQHINEPVPKLPETLAVFQPVIDKALAKDPFHRYTRAREMIDHLEELEPKIKSALLKLRVGNTSDPTVVKRSVPENGDATIVVAHDGETTGPHTGPHTGKVTTEEELTKVLSSAKATIRDFSAESRARRAQRTKQLIIGVSFVAVAAMGYVGYQQLVVVPQERAAADAKIREAELRSQNKIKDLLAQAKEKRREMSPSDLETVDKVIEVYREILKLDPDNKEATFVLEKIGNRYIDMARSAVRRRDLKKATTYRDYAEQLVPSSPQLPGLRNVIKALRAEQIDKQLVQEEVDTLLDVAQKDIDASQGFSDSAYTKLQQALRIDPGNERATTMVDGMLSKLYDDTVTDIEARKVTRARSNIKILEKYYEDPVQVAELNQRLNDVSSKIVSAQKAKSLMIKADRLQREKRTISVNDQLKETYLSILKLDPSNRKGQAGLDDTSAFESGLAREAIDDRDFELAQRNIRSIEQANSRYAELSELRNSLRNAKESNKKAGVLINQARSLIKTETSGEAKRTALFEAYKKLDQAKSIDSGNRDAVKTLEELESEYVATISALISEKNKTLVSAYFSDTDQGVWPSDRLLQLKIAQQKANKKPKRVISGGF